MTTNNSLNLPLSGSTGTGNFVGATSPALVTPVLGAATATSITFSPTTGGIVGTTTNDNADAGNVGEMISSAIASGSAVALTSNVSVNITSISLTAGDWDVFGSVANSPGSGTTQSILIGSISTTSATHPVYPGTIGSQGAGKCYLQVAVAANGVLVADIPTLPLKLSATTTVYLVVSSVFAVSTMGGYGAIIARRVR